MLRSFRAHIQTGEPTSAVAALRILSLLLSFPAGSEKPASKEAADNSINDSNDGNLNATSYFVDDKVSSLVGELSSLHEMVLAFGSGEGDGGMEGDLLEELIGIVKADDPLCSPPAVAIFHALAMGPMRIRASIVFTEIGGNAFIHFLRRLYDNSNYRSCSVELVNCMLSTREGIALCQTNAETIEEIVCGRKVLQANWNAIKNVKF
eukprot:Tbor_TRINITY_DN6106_c0_g1::TRINITY_DN6106_c0_g1_i3::g.21469::m.21469